MAAAAAAEKKVGDKAEAIVQEHIAKANEAYKKLK